MPSGRRVFCKPPGLSEQQSAQLAAALRACVQLQRELAERSPHVLRLVGNLEETPEAFHVTHEPARPLPIAELFNSEMRGWEADQLLGMAVALLDALRVAHELKQQLPVAHGGLCPGAVLIGEDGAEKVTDFGVAGALCAAGGVEAYINLAVGPALPDVPWADASGIWQVLDPEITDREDRICSFIDPEKHASGKYQTFEARADILAAGLLLHLLAERRHAYFYDYADYPEYRRSIELVKYVMSQGAPTGARREDLRKSPREAVKRWCELVAAMIGPSEGRPAADAALRAFAEVGVKPLDAAALANRRYLALCDTLQGRSLADANWVELRRDFGIAAANPVLSIEVRRQAGVMGKLAAGAERIFQENWAEAGPSLEEAIASADLPAPARTLATQAAEIVRFNRGLLTQLDEIAAGFKLAEAADAAELCVRLQTLARKLELAAASGEPLASVQARIGAVRRELSARIAAAEAQKQQIEQAAGACVAGLQARLDAAEWDELQRELAARPSLPGWRPDLQKEVAEIERRVQEHLREVEEERRRHQALVDGLSAGRTLLAEEKFEEARAAVEPAAAQSTYPDLGEQAQALLQQISAAAEQARLRAEAIARIRARIDRRLAQAEERLNSDDMATLDQAEQWVRRALAAPLIEEAQTKRGQQLLARIAQLKQALLDDADRGREFLARAESELAKASALFEQAQFVEAETLAATLAHSPFPMIQAEAESLVGKVGEVRAQRCQDLRQQLERARERLAAEDLEQAGALAREVQSDTLATRELHSEAARLLEEIAVALRSEEEARQAALANAEQAVQALVACELAAARLNAERVVANRHAATEARACAEEVLSHLGVLQEGEALLARGELPDAVGVLERVLQDRSAGESARRAAGTLKARARESQLAMVLGGVKRHLEARAQLEESRGGLDSLPPEESLGHSAPQWMKRTLTPFESFLHDCTLTGRPPEPRTLLQPGHRLGGKYEILEFLGRGGMGQVYRARDLKLQREVALKLARPAAETPAMAEALQHEAQAIARLKHPHIFRINSYDVIDGWHCFDTDYIRGGDLSQHVRGQPLPPRRIAEVLLPIAEALAYAHQQDLLHRDIKPQNIYLGAEPGEGPWLIDFGLAKIHSICETRANTGLCGTPGYIAPEVITSMGEYVDQRADIFALGCVLYGLLAGRPPFQESPSTAARSGPSISRTLLKTLRADYPPLGAAAAGAPPALRRICEKAMAAEPQARHQSASELAEDLREFLRQLDEEQARADLAVARERLARRRVGQPAELADLAEARQLADRAWHMPGAVKPEAQALLDEIDGLRARIEQAQAQAREQVAAAGQALAAGRLRLALTAAQQVLANTYAPELHAQAEPIAAQAGQLLRAARRRRIKISVGALLIVGVAAAVGALVFAVPRFTGQPRNDGKVLQVFARGWPAIRYQWQRQTAAGGWADVPGASADSLTLSSDAAARYRCTITNAFGAKAVELVPSIADTERPTVSISAPSAATTQDSAAELSGTASDNVGVVEVSWSNERGGGGPCTGTTSWRASGIALKEGKNTITVAAKDWAGNIGTSQVELTYAPKMVDTTPPTVAITPLTGGATTSSTPIELTGTAQDAGGIAEVIWANERGGSGACSGTTDWHASGIALKEGENTITITAKDRAGNVGTKQIVLTYKPAPSDTTPRTVVVAAPNGLALAGVDALKARQGINPAVTPLVFTGQAEPGTTVSIRASRASASGPEDKAVEWVNGAAGSGGFRLEVKKSDWGKQETDYNVRAVAASTTGESAPSAPLTIRIDTAPPAGPAQLQHEIDAAKKALHIKGSAEPGSTIALELTPVSGPALQSSFVNPQGAFDAYIPEAGKPPLADGRYTLSARAVDAAGNRSEAKSEELAVDTTEPAVTVDWKAVTPWVVAAEAGQPHVAWCDGVTLTGSANDAISGVRELKINGQSVTIDKDGNWKFQVPIGVSELQFSATDGQGNASAIKETFIWKRADLEQILVKAFNGQPARITPPAGVFDYLTEIARIKWLDATAGNVTADSISQIQETLAGRTREPQRDWQIRPTRFIEYFWGKENLHALLCDVSTAGVLEAAYYYPLGQIADLRARILRGISPSALNGELGSVLATLVNDMPRLRQGRPAFLESVDNRERPTPKRSLGIVMAPDGPLCLIPLLGLPFQEQPIELGTRNSDRLPIKVRSLQELCTTGGITTRAAVWVAVSIGARGSSAGPRVPWQNWLAQLNPDLHLKAFWSNNLPAGVPAMLGLGPEFKIGQFAEATLLAPEENTAAALEAGIQNWKRSVPNVNISALPADPGVYYPRFMAAGGGDYWLVVASALQ